ncbi:hypothetical protein PSAC2689_20024 [Paraburkholderia sacchari]
MRFGAALFTGRSAAAKAVRAYAPGGFFFWLFRLMGIHLCPAAKKWRKTLDFVGFSTNCGRALQ